MRSTNPVVVLVLALALVLFTAVSASAQAGFRSGSGSVAPRGVPASVTSFGFGGHPGFNGVPASVTSLGFGGHAGFRGVPRGATSFGFGAPFRFPKRIGNRPFVVTRRRRFIGSPFFGGVFPVAYPYPFDLGDSGADYMDDPPSAEEQRDYDSRRQLDDDYRAELYSQRREPPPSADPEPVTAQPSTVLVFKDGHQLEVGNYAIVGTTLYDLSDGRSRKVQLADLDLGATLKENDQRGVEFQLPAGTNLD